MNLIKFVRVFVALVGICHLSDNIIQILPSFSSVQLSLSFYQKIYMLSSKTIFGILLIFGLPWNQLQRFIELIKLMNLVNLFPSRLKSNHKRITIFGTLHFLPYAINTVTYITFGIISKGFYIKRFKSSNIYGLIFIIGNFKYVVVCLLITYTSSYLKTYFEIINLKIFSFSRSIVRDINGLNHIRHLYSTNIRACRAGNKFCYYIIAIIYFDFIFFNPIIFYRYFDRSADGLLTVNLIIFI